jgi:hypothetical protein
MKSHNIIDIIERSQTRHALREENELKNLVTPSHSGVALVKNTGGEESTCAIDGIRISTVAIPGRTKWSLPPRWPRSTGRDVGQNRSIAGERLRYGCSRSMGLGSSKEQLQNSERSSAGEELDDR